MSAGPDLDRLAAEHALGLLEGEELARSQRLLEQDEAYARLVGGWMTRFSELDSTVTPVSPRPGLWAAIEADLAAEVSPAEAVRRAPAGHEGARTGLWTRVWESLGFWRGAGLAAGFAALLLAVGLAAALQRAARAPVLVAVLLTDTARPAAVVNAFADGRTELIPLESIQVPPGKALEIWTLWDRARGPVSVGLVGEARRLPLRLDGLPTPAPNQLFEITLEPATGSPTGRPTGPVLMKGTTSTAL